MRPAAGQDKTGNAPAPSLATAAVDRLVHRARVTLIEGSSLHQRARGDPQRFLNDAVDSH